jgi:hypothetical protein
MWFAVLMLALAPLTGCKSLGPMSLSGDRFNYNKALAQSSNEQLLLNIVRQRYGEPLHWLEISSMLSQYSLEARADFSRWWNNLETWSSPALRAIYNVDSDPSSQNSMGAGIAYSDKPTISYAPVQGAQFTQRMLTPIPISVLFFFVQAGWDIDEVFYCCVDKMNGLPNPQSPSPIGIGNSAAGHAAFEQALTMLRNFQDEGRMQGAVEKDGDTGQMYFITDPNVFANPNESSVRKILGIDEGVQKIRITERGYASSGDELAIQTRSLLATMQTLSRFVDIPRSQVEDGMTLEWPLDLRTGIGAEIKSSPVPMADAFVQVFHKGNWFYISEDDVHSKRLFGLLTYLYSIQASNTSERAPLITVGTGR